MAHPHLTEYLLRLATDAGELSRYTGANSDERRAILKTRHLTDAQCDAVLSADSSEIMAEVNAELKRLASAFGGTHYTIQIGLAMERCEPE